MLLDHTYGWWFLTGIIQFFIFLAVLSFFNWFWSLFRAQSHHAELIHYSRTKLPSHRVKIRRERKHSTLFCIEIGFKDERIDTWTAGKSNLTYQESRLYLEGVADGGFLVTGRL